MLNFFRVSKLDICTKIIEDPEIHSHFLLRDGVFHPVLLGAAVTSTAAGGGAGGAAAVSHQVAQPPPTLQGARPR